MKFDSKWYYFDESGHMATGKTEIDGATYYLGTEKDGFMRTGWIRLEENGHAPGASESWYYFNSDGKMVTTQYDKKIDGSYYTFIDGKMQTGWVLMPSKSDVTDSNAASPKITDYQYYGAAGDGKRAEGFRSIEGISGIHAADEVYTFYFKAGKPYVSDKKGIPCSPSTRKSMRSVTWESCRQADRSRTWRTMRSQTFTSVRTVS